MNFLSSIIPFYSPTCLILNLFLESSWGAAVAQARGAMVGCWFYPPFHPSQLSCPWARHFAHWRWSKGPGVSCQSGQLWLQCFFITNLSWTELWCETEQFNSKWAPEERRPWLEGAETPFIIKSDHRNLCWDKPLIFTCFNFVFTCRPASNNIKPETLSPLRCELEKQNVVKMWKSSKSFDWTYAQQHFVFIQILFTTRINLVLNSSSFQWKFPSRAHIYHK